MSKTMFNRLKDNAKITGQDPVFKARYIGNAETFTASGRGCTTQLVQRLWDNSEDEQFLVRVKLKFTTEGINMKFLDKKKRPERMFQIENISFCNVDMVVNDRIFSWISRAADDKMWECHAVICSSPEKAKSMALVLTRAFHIAHKEWKALHTRELRDVERTNRSQSLPAMTLTKTSRTVRSVPKQQSMDVSSQFNTAPDAIQSSLNGNAFAPAVATNEFYSPAPTDTGSSDSNSLVNNTSTITHAQTQAISDGGVRSNVSTSVASSSEETLPNGHPVDESKGDDSDNSTRVDSQNTVPPITENGLVNELDKTNGGLKDGQDIEKISRF